MVQLLKKTDLVPRDGWRAVQPEDGFTVTGRSYSHLLSEVHDYRTGNNLPIEPNFERQVQNQICCTLGPEESCRRCRIEEDPERTPAHLREWASRREDLVDFGTAAETVVEKALLGQVVRVPAAVANERASICAKCPRNLPITNCFTCGTIGRMFRKLAGNLHTSSDALLKSCDVCGCSNAVQVHYTREVLHEIAVKQGKANLSYPEWCWKGKP